MNNLYDVIYDWFSTYVFAGTNIPASSFEVGGQSISLAEWLNHTATIVVLVLMVAFLIGLVVWFGKFIGGMIAKVGR